MENEIYERDYTYPEEDTPSFQRSELEISLRQHIMSSELVKAFDKKFKTIPRMINPKQKVLYERLLRRMDSFALERNGYIKGVIDYKNWDAHIYVVLPFFEFTSEEHYAVLKEITDNSYRLTFTVLEDGRIQLSIAVEYFEELENVQELIQELYKEDEGLSAIIQEIRQAQLAEVLSMPHVKAFLRRNAEANGISEQEVFERVMYIIENDPERIQQWFKDQDAKIDGLFPDLRK